LRVCYSTHAPLLTWGGDDGSDEEAHIRSEGRTNAEAPRGGTQGSGNTQATGDRRQGRSDTEKEQSLGGYQSAPAKADWLWHILCATGCFRRFPAALGAPFETPRVEPTAA
jgi:hypothetical protein